MKKTTIPNQISIARIVLTPLLIPIGLAHWDVVFLVLLAMLLISDFFDGFLARRLHQETRLGSQLDTAGDVLLTIFSIAGGWILWPERVTPEAMFFLSMLALLGLSGIVCLVKYRHFPTYHAWSAKISTAVAGTGVWILFAGITPWVFRIAIGVLAFSAVEEILITLILPSWRPNVPTVFHALRLRKLSG
ncbi:MAG: CDP-alcohol phosphatidyltransferase family protein [Kiritimatiellales bacterium]|nr:CDP-alcohol phosphatidyltransferase family protein [Kiritimatiellales bacterium]